MGKETVKKRIGNGKHTCWQWYRNVEASHYNVMNILRDVEQMKRCKPLKGNIDNETETLVKETNTQMTSEHTIKVREPTQRHASTENRNNLITNQ